VRHVRLEPSCFRFDFLGLGGPARFPEALAHKLDTASGITTLACSPDGQYLAQFGMNHPKVFQARSGKVVREYSWMMSGALWAPDSRRFVAVGRPRQAGDKPGKFSCALFDVESGAYREFPVNDAVGKSLVNEFLELVAWLDGDRVAWVGRSSLGTGEVPLQLIITNVKTGRSQACKLHL
jgi:hypothetical protein